MVEKQRFLFDLYSRSRFARSRIQGFVSLLILLLGSLSPMCQAHAAPEIKTLKTPQGISVLFWEMPHASTVSLSVGFKHAGPQHYAISNLLARTLQKGVEEGIKLPPLNTIKKLSFGDVLFDYKCFNFHLESEVAYLEEALQWVVQHLTLERVGTTQFEAARRDVIKELQQKRTESPLQKQVKKTVPAIAVLYKKRELREFVWRQIDRQLGIPPLQEVATLKRLPWKAMTDYAARYFDQDHLIIGVAGSIPPEQLLGAIDRTLGQLPKHTSVPKETKDTPSVIKPSKLPKKQFFYQKDTRIPTLNCFAQPLPDAVQLNSYARVPLISLIHDMLQFYIKEIGNLDFKMDELSIYSQEGRRHYLSGCFTSDMATQYITGIEQCFRSLKAGGVNTPWFVRYLAQLKQNQTIEKLRKECLEAAEEDPIFMRQVERSAELAAYYVLNRQAEVLSKFPPNPEEYATYLQKVQVDELLPLMQSMLNPDQLVFTVLGRENPFK